jgi:tetratricopeptide (TPR) repeat protein
MSRLPTTAARRRAAPQEAREQLFSERFGLAVILLLTFLVYLPALGGGKLWDDSGHITRPDLRTVGGLGRIWFDVRATQQYYPLLHTAFWIEHKLWGDTMLGYHLINLAWHMVAVVLVYAIVKKLNIPGALLAAAIFALHPVMVESVAWVTEQKNTLSAVFYLSAMHVYLDFDETRNRGPYFLALGLFVLGLLTKTVTATLPAALLVIFWWKRGTLSWRRDVWPLAPFFLLGAVAGITTAYIERTLIGAEGAGYEMSFLARCLLAGRVIWFYLSKLLWPANLIFIYPRWTIDPTVWWQWLFPLAAVGVTVGLALNHQRWRGPLAGWLLFVGTLFPVLGFLNVFPFIYSYVADHFQYLASLGLIVLAAAGIVQAVGRLAPPMRNFGVGFCFALIGVLAAFSFRQASKYSDSATLYRATLERNPACWMAHSNLGEILAEKNSSEAIAHYEAALELRPDYPEAHNNLGNELAKAGRLQEAIDHFEQAVRARPNFSVAHTNHGIALYRLGKVPQAADEFRLALEYNRNNARAHANLASILSNSGDMETAVAHYEEAVRLVPEQFEVQYRFAEVLRQMGRLEQAIEHYQAALRSEPNFVDIYADLAAALASVNKPSDAVTVATKGVEVGRATGQTAAADRLEEWLKHYRSELQRTSEAAKSP